MSRESEMRRCAILDAQAQSERWKRERVARILDERYRREILDLPGLTSVEVAVWERHMTLSELCSFCRGEGFVGTGICQECRGKGHTSPE